MSTVMQRLRDYLKDNKEFKQAFEKSFELAQQYKIPQFAEYKLTTFDDYIKFYEDMLTWVPTENMDGSAVYYHLCVSYFVINLPPVRAYQTPIRPDSVEPWGWLSQWLIDWAKEIGKFADDERSINAKSLETFKLAKNYRIDDYKEPEKGWKTFNEFFARELKDGKRPIDGREKVIVSPADSVFDGWWQIDDKAEVTLKHLRWSITELLKDSDYGSKFSGGKFMHAFLNTNDYHRQHAPVAGKVLEAKVIQGLCYLEVSLTYIVLSLTHVLKVAPEPADENGKHGLSMRRRIHPPSANGLEDPPVAKLGEEAVMPDSPGYQFLQARGCIIIDTTGYENDIGLVAVLPIGMAMVSSVVLNPKIIPVKGQKNPVVKKGEEISHFEMGGSDIVVCFQKQSKGDVIITTPFERHNDVGKEIAVYSPDA